jgi:O-antigen ligase
MKEETIGFNAKFGTVMEISYLKSNITKSIFTWLLCLTYVGMFFPIQISNIPLIALFGFCFLNLNLRTVITSVKKSLFAKAMIGMFLVQVLGLLYTSNYVTGLFMLEKKICFLLFPLLVLPMMEKVYQGSESVLKTLGVITLISSLILFIIAFYRKFVLHDPHAFFFESFRDFEGFSPIHYVYYSMYFGCGSLMLLDYLFDDSIKRKYGWLVLAALYAFSLGVIMLVASKTGILIFLLASISLLFIRIGNKKIFALTLLFIALLTFLQFYFNETTQSRFRGLSEQLAIVTQDELIGGVNFTGLNMRLVFWKIQIAHSWKDNLLLTGVGTGDVQDYIDSLYKLKQYQLYGYVGWDSHNQWVFTLIQLGLAGIAMMAVLYFGYLKKAARAKDVKFLCFLIITLGFSFSESILETNKGIVFFSFFFTLLSAPYGITSRSDQNPFSINV